MKKIVLAGMVAALCAAPVYAADAQKGKAQGAQGGEQQARASRDVTAALNDLAKAPKFHDAVNELVYSATMSMPVVLIPGYAKAAQTMRPEQTSDKYGREVRQIIAAAGTVAQDPAVAAETQEKLLALLGKRLGAEDIARVAAFYRSPQGAATLTVLPEGVVQEAMDVAQDVLKPRVQAVIGKQKQPNAKKK
jgi:hypothetical protein